VKEFPNSTLIDENCLKETVKDLLAIFNIEIMIKYNLRKRKVVQIPNFQQSIFDAWPILVQKKY